MIQDVAVKNGNINVDVAQMLCVTAQTRLRTKYMRAGMVMAALAR